MHDLPIEDYDDDINVIRHDKREVFSGGELQFKGMRKSMLERKLDMVFKGVISASCLTLVVIGVAIVMSSSNHVVVECPPCPTPDPLLLLPVTIDEPPPPIVVVNVPRPPRSRIPTSV